MHSTRSTPFHYYVLAKRSLHDWPRPISIDHPEHALNPSASRNADNCSVIAQLQAMSHIGTDPLSIRIGGHLFAAAGFEQVALFETLTGRSDGPISSSPCHPLTIPHRTAFRIEIDGLDYFPPAIAVCHACFKFRWLVELLQRRPELRWGRSPLQLWDLFIPFFSGNRSLHLLLRSASPWGTGYSEGNTQWCHLVNEAARQEWGPTVGNLVDPGNHCNVRSPWRAMCLPHEKTRLWANPLPWSVVWNCDGNAIVELARRPLYSNCLTAAMNVLGFSRPPAPELQYCFDYLRDLGQLREQVETLRRHALPPGIEFEQSEFSLDFKAALQDFGCRLTQTSPTDRFIRITTCPGCQRDWKAYVTPSGWLHCWRSSCRFSTKTPPLGDNGWMAQLGIDPVGYGAPDLDTEAD